MVAFPILEDFDDPSFNPFMSEEIMFGTMADPWTRLAELRRQAPVQEISYRPLMGLEADASLPDRPHYLVLGYDEVSEVLTNPQTYHQGYIFNLGTTFGRSLSVMEPPEHTGFRRIFQRAFLPKIVSNWGETLVDPVIDELISAFEKRGEADLVQDFAIHYPFRIIYRQLGLPEEQVVLFHKMAIAQTVYWAYPEKAQEASRKLGDFFEGLVEARKREPGDDDDLVTRLITAEVDGEKISNDVIISFLRQLVNAAGDTTFRMTSSLLAGLLENPDQLEAIRKDRSLIPQGIEEGLRWEGPVMIQERLAAVDTTLGGVAVPAGSFVDVAAGAANRDERRFPNPDKFDIFRARQNGHVGFSRGPHICIGMHLARVEMTRALHAILDRLPNLRLDPDKSAPEIRGINLRKPEHIYVKFDPVV